MATALTDTTTATPTKLDARVEEQLGKAAGKIRSHDLLTGALALVVLTLAYAVAGVLLDQSFDLPRWVRQLSLGGFALAFAGLGYLLIVRPLRRAINPRYAARRVEQTIPDAKNALINWVDLRDEGLPEPVRAVVGARAVDGVTDADVNQVGESRRLVWLAATAGLLAAAVAVLVVVLKPAPFLSLVGRTFNPFASTAIATRTTIELTEPAGGDVTVTADDPLRIAVHVGGTVPDADAPDRLRLDVRYTPDGEYEPLPLEEAGSAREWAIQVPRSVVQNGFWYRVAGGDAVTPEYRVTVRSRPMVKGFEAEYEYPAYTRMKKEVGREAELRAYRGTQVTLTVATNRKLKNGDLWIDGQPEAVRAEVVAGEKTDALRYRLTLTQNGTYRVNFTSAEGEPSDPTPGYPIRVLADQKPTVVIDPLPPEEEGKPLPTNGQLKVNGTIGDDFGIDTAVLRLRLHQGATAIDLQPKAYRDGASFRRESDNTWPTTVQYKDSVALPELKDANGQPVAVADGMELEYWLEATDNCTVPKANVGRSAPKRVRIATPPPQPEQPQQQRQARQDRLGEEKQHRQQQDQQLKAEQRDAPPPLRQDPPQEENPPPKNEGQDQGQPKAEGQPGKGEQPPKGENPPPKSEPAPMPTPKGSDKGQDTKTPPDAPMPPEGPKAGTPDAPPPMPGGTPDAPKTPEAPMPRTAQDPAPKTAPPTDPKVQEQAEKVRDAIEQQQQQPGQARPQEPNDPKAERPPAEPKKGGEPQPGSQAQPKPGEPTDPMGQPTGTPASDTKGAGNLDRTDPSQPKPEPKPGEPTPDGKPNPQPTGEKPGDEKPGKPAGQDAGTKPKPGDMKDTDPGAARPAADPKAPQDKDPKGGTDAAEPKGKPDPARGQERPTQQPTPGAGGQPKPDETPAQGRGQKPTDPAKPKPQPSGQPDKTPQADPKPVADGADPKRPEQAPADAKPAGTPDPKAPQGQPGAADPKGDEKPSPTPGQPKAGKGGGQKQKMDPKEMEKAIQDLANGNDEQKQAAKDKLDQSVGKDARQRAEKIAEDLKSGDPKKQQEAKKQAGELSRETSRGGDIPPPPDENVERLVRDKAEDLGSDDAQKREAAEKELDGKIGKDQREQLQKKARDLKSPDPKTRDAARKDIDELAKKAGQNAQGGQPPRQPTKEEIDQLAKKAQDLASPDEKTRKAAEQEFDKAMGKENRERLQQDMKDLASGDKERQAAAQKRIEEMAKKADPTGKVPQPSKEEMEKLAQKAQDLNSPDQGKKEAAEKEFDQRFGKDQREQLQQNLKDLQSKDQAKQDAARKRMEDMAKAAAEKGGKGGEKLSQQDIEQLKKQAEDLASKDEARRKAAEEAFDKKLGKDLREKIQNEMKDLKSDDPQKQAEAMKRLQEMANNLPKGSTDPSDPSKDWRPGAGAKKDENGKPLEDNPTNRLKTAELQLQQFEKQKYNKELLNKLGYTSEEYEDFLKAYRELVDRQRDEVARGAEQPKDQPPPTGPAALKVGEGSGNKALEKKGDGTAPGGAAGTGTAPPGYSDPQRKFAEEAAKLKKDKK